ncbi:MAG: PEP-CTERM sorting domain-containing protein [Thermoguttaceae bacterium]
MSRLRFLVPLFMVIAVATMARPALARFVPVPEPSSMVVFAGLAAMGVIGMFWRQRRRRP